MSTITEVIDFNGAALTLSKIMNSALAGNIESIIFVIGSLIVLIALFIGAYKVSKAMFVLVKRLFLFVIVMLFEGVFLFNSYDKIFSPNPDLGLVAIAIIGMIFAIITLVISVLSLSGTHRKTIDENYVIRKLDDDPEYLQLSDEDRERVREKLKVEANRGIRLTTAKSPGMFTQPAAINPSQQGIMNLGNNAIMKSFQDKSLLAVLAYIVVSEFGIFSAPTISAPNPFVGIGLAIAFFVAAIIFIKTSYHNYFKGITHLAIATIFAVVLSIILAVLWVELPLEILLSLQYFETNALVATVTGLAVSLFLGSKNWLICLHKRKKMNY